ncbi:MAG: hypothetical protein COB12_10570 [Flavobacterium sp.]|nr:MAG: hypothetical protein COB12_10570 [Flavobacterium sp.]
MKRFKVLIVILLFFQFSFGQESENESFPESYFGIYKGELQIYGGNATRTFPMEFHFLPSDSTGVYKYMLVYGSGDVAEYRKYALIEKDKEQGVYLLDELNGIQLDCQVIDNKMYFLFQVKDSLLTTFVTFEKDQLYFEIIATDTKKKNTSGGQDEETPEVFSYPIGVVQKAILIKQ